MMLLLLRITRLKMLEMRLQLLLPLKLRRLLLLLRPRQLPHRLRQVVHLRSLLVAASSLALSHRTSLIKTM